MLELFGLVVLLGICALVVAAVFGILKLVFAVLFWPVAAFFWVVGGALRILFLPFQLLGGLLLVIFLLPLLLVGLPILLGIGVPLVLAAFAVFGLFLVCAVFCWMGGMLFGVC